MSTEKKDERKNEISDEQLEVIAGGDGSEDPNDGIFPNRDRVQKPLDETNHG